MHFRRLAERGEGTGDLILYEQLILRTGGCIADAVELPFVIDKKHGAIERGAVIVDCFGVERVPIGEVLLSARVVAPNVATVSWAFVVVQTVSMVSTRDYM